ncbi:MAG: hypothetical protein ACK5WS_03400 [Alphaproteobacteria bacterium]|jgi:hypothetical protein|nr:hypothetical protein [Candidatus Jidaibacter sp.]
MRISEKWYNILFTVLINIGMTIYMTTFWHLVVNEGDVIVDILLTNVVVGFVVSLPFIFLLLFFVRVTMNKFFTVKK